MKKRRSVFLIVIVLCLNGCTRLPFEKIDFVSLEGADANVVKSDFTKEIADDFYILESVVFEYRGRKMTSLSYTQVDEPNTAYSMTAISPQGISLASIDVDKENLDYEFYLPIIKEKKMDEEMIAKKMSRDLRRVYLERLPSDRATLDREKDRMVFKEIVKGESCQWTFAGFKTRLYEKRCDLKGKKLWRVRYFDYQERNSKIYPSKIYFENDELNYKVTLRLKEILE